MGRGLIGVGSRCGRGLDTGRGYRGGAGPRAAGAQLGTPVRGHGGCWEGGGGCGGAVGVWGGHSGVGLGRRWGWGGRQGAGGAQQCVGGAGGAGAQHGWGCWGTLPPSQPLSPQVFISKDVARHFGYQSAPEALWGLRSRVQPG